MKEEKRLPNSIKTFIKSQDLFGHIIHLNFDQDGIEHQTLIGGIASFFIRVFMLIYVLLLFQKLIFNLDDKNVTDIGIIDLKELG